MECNGSVTVHDPTRWARIAWPSGSVNIPIHKLNRNIHWVDKRMYCLAYRIAGIPFWMIFQGSGAGTYEPSDAVVLSACLT